LPVKSPSPSESPVPTLRDREGRGKTFSFKIHVSSDLKQALKKHQKKGLKKLVKANKGGTFAPATTQTFFNKLASNTN
jgi:hypothetical protein